MFIIGLGNPGKKYQLHRHNVGHMFVDWLAKRQSVQTWHSDSHKMFDYQKSSSQNNLQSTMVKTRTYMNESGKSVLALLRYFHIDDISNLYVAHDDLDLPVGVWKLDFAKGPKLHSGINSIESSNRTNNFWRLRIGVDNRTIENRIAGDVYVLQDFTDEELAKVSAHFPAMWERIVRNNK